MVGINSLKISDSNYELMGFAIPISSAKEIIDDIIAYGRVPNRPKLGISYFSNTSNQQYNMIVQIKGLPAGSLIIADINEDSDLANSSAQVGAAGVTGADSRRMLDALHGVAYLAADGSRNRGDHAVGKRAEELDAAGVAYGVYRVADEQCVGVAEFGGLKPRDLYPEHADISPLTFLSR